MPAFFEFIHNNFIDKCKALLPKKTIYSLRASIHCRQLKNLLHNTQQSSWEVLDLLKDNQKTSTFLKAVTISMSLPSKQMRRMRSTFQEKEGSVKYTGESAKKKIKIRKLLSKLCKSRTKVVNSICRKTQRMPKLGPSSAAAEVRWNCRDIHDQNHGN